MVKEKMLNNTEQNMYFLIIGTIRYCENDISKYIDIIHKAFLKFRCASWLVIESDSIDETILC